MNELWVPLLGTFVPLVGAGLIAWGGLRKETRWLRADVDARASKELVEHQYAEIIARLDRIEKRVNGE